MTAFSNSLPNQTPPPLPRFRKADPISIHSRRNASGPLQRQRILKPEFEDMRLGFDQGTTWLRLLPPHADSLVPGPFYCYEAYDLAPKSGGLIPEIAAPNSLLNVKGAADPIRIFAAFLDANFPHLVHQFLPENNEQGLALWPKQRAAVWAYVHRTPNGPLPPGDFPVKIWLGSNYDGAFNNAGVLFSVQELFRKKRLTPSGAPGPLIFGDLSDPETGRLLAVSARRDPGKRFRFELQPDENPSPLAMFEGLFAAHPSFRRLHVPIETVIRQPQENELFRTLELYLEHKLLVGGTTAEAVAAFVDCFGRAPCGQSGAALRAAAQVHASPQLTALPSAMTTVKPPHVLEDDLDVPAPSPTIAATSPAPDVPAIITVHVVDTPAVEPPPIIPPKISAEPPAVPLDQKRSKNPSEAPKPRPTKATGASRRLRETTQPTVAATVASTSARERPRCDALTGSKSELMAEVDAALKGDPAPNIDECRLQLVWRFSAELSDAEFTQIYRLSPVGSP
jgi:hypothetical protein